MNDEISGQLTKDWTIPGYMQTHLWLEGDGGTAKTEGPYGLFEFPAPCPIVTLRWGGERGSALIQFPWQPDSLEWDGSVRVGGYVDAIVTGKDAQTGLSIAVISVGGQPINAQVSPYPPASARERIPYQSPDFHQGVAMDVGESLTTWIIRDDSSLMAAMRDALIHNLRLHVWGRFVENDHGWHEQFAMPIFLEAVTLFGP